MARLAAVIYDLDGTLIDSRADLADSVNAMLARMDLPRIEDRLIHGFIGEGAERLIRRSLGSQEHRYPEAAPIWRAEYQKRLLHKTRLYPGVRELLAAPPELRAVLTNKPGGFARQILAGLGVAAAFREIAGGDEAARKPDPAGVLLVCERLGVRREEALLVGDSAVDLATARAAGISVCAVTWGLGDAAALASADYLCHNAAEVALLLKGLTMGIIAPKPVPEPLDSSASAGERPSARGAAGKERAVGETVRITAGGQELELPVVVGTEGERGIEIVNLRAKTGMMTLDPAFMNTASTESAITFLDGEKGILRYRGIPIEELGEKSSFTETAYLLIYGHLPNKDELHKWEQLLTRHSMIHEDMKRFFDGYPMTAHPMAILSAMITSLSSFYPYALNAKADEYRDITIARLIAKMPTIAAFSYKKSIGHPFVYPRNDLNYCANFLHEMFAVPAEAYQSDPVAVRALNLLLILHADHEQNCSTSTVRIVGSAQTNLFASISAGICALWGPLHGGANQEVVEMLTDIRKRGLSAVEFIAQVKDKKSGARLMGFGHRVYKNFDPRAKIIKKACDEVLARMGIRDPMLDLAKELEEAALKDPYFIERKLYPNVDFYSGIIYRALGIPTGMFTVMFALGRLPGWIAHWKEMIEDPNTKIGRPRQIYTGARETHYVPIEKRA
ncbi:MAG TPA: citrate synthase [Myxococcales bacterium]